MKNSEVSQASEFCALVLVKPAEGDWARSQDLFPSELGSRTLQNDRQVELVPQRLVGPDVTGGTLGTGYAALVGRQGTVAGRYGVRGRAADQQGMGIGGAAVVL
jgi:hypothetical protein